ncbi:hypothetical protein K432DRAFT_421762 [Lepidopterella palustris CBS 459.81]|uniref:Apple domain-containing protein n=1 Tax=Lepidopterella palustris CBS 459.81 TaxID=1314670 RepID=A0A8E2JK99_9PEZI|nr:hypothetical protein K432DRAFT_421762 [Lepidopterella palustris CBS 459.81]
MADAPSVAHHDRPEVYQYSDGLYPHIPSEQHIVQWVDPEHVVGYQDTEKKPKRVGLRKPKFWLLIVLAIVVVGAVVGGAVGGSLAAIRKATKSSSTSSPKITQITTAFLTTPTPTPAPTPSASESSAASATAYSVLAATAISQLPLPACPTDTATVFHPSHNSSASYKPECYLNFSGNDIMGLIAYSFEDCLDACDRLNYYQEHDLCVIAEFTRNMAYSVGAVGLNCYLKQAVNPQTSKGDDLMSARLCRDAACNSLAG